jgi:hypothetical protein
VIVSRSRIGNVLGGGAHPVRLLLDHVRSLLTL